MDVELKDFNVNVFIFGGRTEIPVTKAIKRVIELSRKHCTRELLHNIPMILNVPCSFVCSFIHLKWRIQDFPEEGALTPKGGRQPIIWLTFPENCMKMKKFWARGEGAAPPLDPPLIYSILHSLNDINEVSKAH